MRAVLDWELSTLGDPMADFSYLLIAWVIPASLRNGLAGADLEALGIPSVEATVERYAEKTGTAAPQNLDWLFAYNLFRLAAICQGIAGRVRDGTAASGHAEDHGGPGRTPVGRGLELRSQGRRVKLGDN